MKAQGILALVAITIGLGQVGPATAQALPPMAGPPVYDVQSAYPPPYYANRFGSLYDASLLPQEIVEILQSTGYAILGTPVRHGRFYVVTALHPNGDDGRVTIDAFTGRFVRFVPAAQVGVIETENVAAYPPPPPPPVITASRPAIAQPPRPGLRPPTALPKVASRAPATTPIPAPKPAQIAKPAAVAPAAAAATPSGLSLQKAAEPVQETAAPQGTDVQKAAGIQKTADSSQAAAAKLPDGKPADSKPAVELRPTEPAPPVQTLE